MAEQPNGQKTFSKDFQPQTKAKQLDVQNGWKLRAIWGCSQLRDILTTFGHRSGIHLGMPSNFDNVSRAGTAGRAIQRIRF
jgi:hypothetical protein